MCRFDFFMPNNLLENLCYPFSPVIVLQFLNTHIGLEGRDFNCGSQNARLLMTFP